MIEQLEQIFCYNRFIYNEIDVIKMWTNLWYSYICGIIDYFSKLNKLDRLLIFDIEKDDPIKFKNFFKKFNININSTKYGHDGLSSAREIPPKYNPNILKWIENQQAKWPWLNKDNEMDAIRKICKVEI